MADIRLAALLPQGAPRIVDLAATPENFLPESTMAQHSPLKFAGPHAGILRRAPHGARFFFADSGGFGAAAVFDAATLRKPVTGITAPPPQFAFFMPQNLDTLMRAGTHKPLIRYVKQVRVR